MVWFLVPLFDNTNCGQLTDFNKALSAGHFCTVQPNKPTFTAQYSERPVRYETGSGCDRREDGERSEV